MTMKDKTLLSQVFQSETAKCLLIEDSPSQAHMLRAVLGSIPDSQFDLTHFKRFETGFNAIGSEKFDFLLLDLNLPDSSPDETVRGISLFPSDLPVIVLTGTGDAHDDELELSALNHGADEFLRKEDLGSSILSRCIAHAVERNRILEELRRRERQLEKYKIAIDASPAVVAMKDLEGRYELVNPRWEEVTGVAAEEALGSTSPELFGEEIGRPMAERDDRVIETKSMLDVEESIGFEGEVRLFRTVRIPFHGDEGELKGIVTIAQDVTERAEMLNRLERQSFRDQLTGLPNRALFRDRLTQVIERARRRGEQFGMAVVDVDDFHVINDSLGHAVADEVLCRIGKRLRGILESEDTLARFGADEFGCIFGEVGDRARLEEIGLAIEELFSEPLDGYEAELRAAVSVGFAYVDDPREMKEEAEEEFDALTRTAVRALREAKRAEGTSWMIYERSNWGEGSRRIQRSNRIRTGIRKGEFLPYFQPVYYLETDRVMALEVLARWDRPKKGLVSPAEFIPLAEETGLMGELGKEVMRRAFREVGEVGDIFGDGSRVELLVNLSPRQLERPGLAEDLLGLIDDEAPEWIDVGFEITETEILKHRTNVLELREAGHDLWVDDFGTGHSSLSRIKEVPLDGLKLDMEFVHGITERTEDGAIAYTVIELGRRLGIPVIAEGVETSGQYEFLKSTNCTAAQGYLFAHPQPIQNLGVVFDE